MLNVTVLLEKLTSLESISLVVSPGRFLEIQDSIPLAKEPMPTGFEGMKIYPNPWCPNEFGMMTDSKGKVRIIDFRTEDERAADEAIRANSQKQLEDTVILNV